MRSKCLLMFISVMLVFMSCRKDNSTGKGYPVEGTWQQTKLRIYGDSLGTITNDTTYTEPFTTSDYAVFKSNGNCVIASDHYYYPNILGYPKTPQLIPVSIFATTYQSIGASRFLIIQNGPVNFGGFVVADTAEVLNPHLLLIHNVFYSHDPSYKNVSDAYYEKE